MVEITRKVKLGMDETSELNSSKGLDTSIVQIIFKKIWKTD